MIYQLNEIIILKPYSQSYQININLLRYFVKIDETDFAGLKIYNLTGKKWFWISYKSMDTHRVACF